MADMVRTKAMRIKMDRVRLDSWFFFITFLSVFVNVYINLIPV
jgi:hypothetical protein